MDFIEDSPESDSLEPQAKPGAIRIILADSQAIYRVGIRKIFALEDDLRVVAQADTLENLRGAVERYPSDVVLLEGALIANASGAITDLLRIAPDSKIIVQAVSNDESHTVELYRNGVRGIISRSISPDLLVRCVRRIAAGETWIDNQSVNWVIEAYRAQAAALVSPKTCEQRLYISSLAPQAQRISQAVRSHWSVENRLHWCMDVIFQDDQMRARSGHAAHNLAVLKHITLNLIRLDPVKRKGGIKARRLIAATSDAYRAELLGLT